MLAGATLSALFVSARADEGAASPAGAVPVAIAAADPFSALVGKARPGEPRRGGAIQRYAIASDGRMFLVEGKVGRARLKYLCAEGDERLDCSLDPEAHAEEIFIATGARGPRGDVIYKGETGEVLLRIMSYGGATVFWPGKANGEAASKSYGDDAALSVPPADRADAQRRATLATEKVSALAGGSILFNPGAVPAVEPHASEDASVLADAIVRAAAGIAAVAGDQTGARVLRERIGEVKFAVGAPPRLSLDGKSLTVVYDPSADAAGRPSSLAVRKFLEDSL